MQTPIIKLYVTSHCPFCTRAKQYLQSKKIDYELIDLTHSPEDLIRLKEKTHWRTVPQIFVGKTFIGGYTDMVKLDEEGKFIPLIEAETNAD